MSQRHRLKDSLCYSSSVSDWQETTSLTTPACPPYLISRVIHFIHNRIRTDFTFEICTIGPANFAPHRTESVETEAEHSSSQIWKVWGYLKFGKWYPFCSLQLRRVPSHCDSMRRKKTEVLWSLQRQDWLTGSWAVCHANTFDSVIRLQIQDSRVHSSEGKSKTKNKQLINEWIHALSSSTRPLGLWVN